ncbi:MAG TPA: uracil-DNA glycosylase [Eubacteriales bacterium]|jgi:uracil-DNA glycosylase|nr:uracil-DNA glycosylase [Clostridia bacterium]HRV73043.1 uracil-DNA glycosylase [Eubacteriales bacterium]
MVRIGNDWDEILAGEFEKEYYQKLRLFLIDEYRTHKVYPDMHDIFNAIKLTSFQDTKVVIIGQDPYHGAGQAHGLCFSVKDGVEPPPSLKNIFKEIHDDLGLPIPNTGELTPWAKQGVLLLNAVLTVREHEPNSHKAKGWEIFTSRVISELNRKETPVVFLLWGANARAKAQVVTNPIHKKLCTVHPSPLSAYNGYFGCRHFSKTNELLTESGQTPIDWSL